MVRRTFTGNVLTYGLGQTATLATGLVFSLITARVLGPSGKGELALFTAIATVAAVALDPGLRPALSYSAARGVPVPPLLATGLVAGLGTAIALVGSRWLVPSLDLWIPLFVGAYLARDVVRFILQGKERMAEVTALSLTYSIVALLSFLVLVEGFGWGVPGAKASLVVGLLVSIPIGVSLLRIAHGDLLGARPSRALFRQLLDFGWRAYPGWLFTVLGSRIELFVVAAFLHERGAGLFSIVLIATELVGHVPMTLGAVLFPRVASDASGASFYTGKCLRHATVVTALTAVSCWLFAEPLVRVLYTDDFAPAGPALAIASLGWVFMSIRTILSDAFAGSGRPQWQSFGSAAYASLVLVLSVLLVPRFALRGAAIAQVVANLVACLLLLAAYTREQNQSAVSILRYRSEDFRDYGRLLQAVYRRQ